MRNHLLTLFLFVSVLSQAQQNKIALGFQLSRDKISGEGTLIGQSEFYYDRIKRDEFNFSTGLTARFLTNSDFSFQSGLYYSQKDFAASYDCPQCQYFLWLTIAIPEPVDIKSRYLTVPFIVRYNPSRKKFSPVLEAGLTNNFLISDGDFDYTKPAFMEGVVGLGFNYQLNQKWSLELKYNYRTSLTAIYKGQQKWQFTDENDPNRLKTNSFQFGLSYLLK